MTQNTNKIITSSSSPRSSRKKIIYMVISGLAALLVVGFLVAILTGWVSVVPKKPNQKAIAVSSVCADDTVKQFNTIMGEYYSDDSTAGSATELDAFVGDFSKDASYKDDPTCLFIKYRVATLKTDYEAAKALVGQLGQLTERGLYIDGRINGLVNLDSMSQSVQLLAPSEEIEFDE